MPFDDFREITKLAEAFHRARVRDDLNNDMAGRNVGRITRVAHDGVGVRGIEEQKRRERIDNLLFETALETLMRDPVYRAQHEAFGAFLDTYGDATRNALEQAQEISAAAQIALESALAGTSTLNGRAVFVTDDGRIVFANGQEIDTAQADQIAWREGATTYSAYLALQENADVAARSLAQILDYQAELDAARSRWNDPHNPYESAEEIERDQKRLETNAPEIVSQQLEGSMKADQASPSRVEGGKPII